MIIHNTDPIQIESEEGFVLFNGETYTTYACLGKYDTPDNWAELPAMEVPED